MKRIVFVSNTSWNLVNFRMPLIKELLLKGNQVFCLAPKDNFTKILEALPGLHYLHLKYVQARGMNPFFELLLMAHILVRVKRIKPDLVISYTIKPNIYAGIICRWLNIPIMNNITGLGSEYKEGRGFSKAIGKMLHYTLEKSTAVIFHNSADKECLIRDAIIQEKNTYVINGSGIDIEFFKCRNKIRRVNKFLFLGRLLPEKGILEFIDAAREILIKRKDVSFTIVGDSYSVDNEEIRIALERIRDDKSFTIRKFTDDPRSCLEKSDCLILPSSREGLSKSLMEAMSMERVVIASNVPGCSELLDNGKNGVILEEISWRSVYNAISTVLDMDENEILLLTESARNKIKSEYTAEFIVNQYNNILHQNFLL
ncbi:MAG: glycosyltransferase family 4 protein [Saprospiraceae bacterium]|nr:glycosyltransferase family 4 protein [Saprospiraceae bacterium]